MGVSCTIECRCPHGAVRGEGSSRGGVLWRLGAAGRRPVPVPMGDCRRPRRGAGCGRRVCLPQRMARVPVAVPPARGHRRCSDRGRVRLRCLRVGFSPLHECNRGRGTPYRLSISRARGGTRHARTYGCTSAFSAPRQRPPRPSLRLPRRHLPRPRRRPPVPHLRLHRRLLPWPRLLLYHPRLPRLLPYRPHPPLLLPHRLRPPRPLRPRRPPPSRRLGPSR